jgi:hypothetical protein
LLWLYYRVTRSVAAWYSKVVATLLLADKVVPFQEIKTPSPGVQIVFWQQTLQSVVGVMVTVRIKFGVL